MAKVTVDKLITRTLERLAWPATTAAKARVLQTLQEGEYWIAAQGSFRHLAVESTLTLASGASSVSAPTDIDIGKDATIGLPGGGSLTFLTDEEFLDLPRHSYGAWDSDRPTGWKWGTDSNGVLQVHFNRTNATGSNIVYAPFTYQQLPNEALADSSSSKSSLPEGYETILLVPWAEMEEKRKRDVPGWREIKEDLMGADGEGGQLGRFFSQYRTSKDRPRSDIEEQRRLVLKRARAEV